MNAIVKIKYEDYDQSFDNNGWFNATEAAKRFKKRANDWINLPETQRYIEALLKREFSKSDTKLSGITNFVKTRKGNSRQFSQGTWLHPKLAVRFAQWLDFDFAIWCDEQIDNLLRTNQAPPSIQDMIRLMLLPTATTWEKRFPDSYYKALAKITGTKFNNHIGGSPAIFGDITNKWIYRIIMPKEVVSELRANKRDGEKMHQWLTNGGEHMLSKQINAVEVIANSSTDYQDFTARCYQAFPQAKGQLRLVMQECVA
ncbi:KilA-N domain-containing protein [Acinetobacter bereziniae]|uniref:KilA-N domain-containing protein n=1 Tax=Acinetobacter bereziniae TaxID=106648 RepID=UPI0019004DAB|nr:KilA-N domain-containing protein [Acinetobacter bereziniae]MBJ9904816.1 KilA-N domain-containing protein [Acinetobacter bereziniae]MCU4317899.1 KilA-N domain-containing protein [Acinetobacter bereziniae]MCU4600150.1 KilA-N domain-containing protein [Acinetobacter bereziniae]